MRRTSLAVVVFAIAVAGAQSGSYHIARTYPLGGDGSWDYIVPDPPNHRLFIARQNRVMVVDEDSGKLLGEVAGIHGAHGTAIAASSGHGFVERHLAAPAYRRQSWNTESFRTSIGEVRWPRTLHNQ